MTIREIMEMCLEPDAMNVSVWDLDANCERYRGQYCFIAEALKDCEVQSFDVPCMMYVEGVEEIVTVFNI